MAFQSAPPVRGAISFFGYFGICARVSIRAPRAGGDPAAPSLADTARVSIRAPRAGGDLAACLRSRQQITFQSAPPVRGAMVNVWRLSALRDVSIRAPRAGGDLADTL